MASRVFAYTTKELSKETWPDFARLFSGGGGWDFCWCMHFQRAYASSKDNGLTTRKNKIPQTRAARSVRNRREKKRLVERGVAHGILVYAHGGPVGWCQYGPREELPRIDNYRKYRALAPGRATERLWRITCFVVDRKVRCRGIARAALRAALDAIRKKGGGLIEAYPIIRWKAGTFGNVSTHGTVSMFEKEGFSIVAPFGGTKFQTNVLVRRNV
jgi:GNAT superfamily N-acetyltransferase